MESCKQRVTLVTTAYYQEHFGNFVITIFVQISLCAVKDCYFSRYVGLFLIFYMVARWILALFTTFADYFAIKPNDDIADACFMYIMGTSEK